MSRLTFNREVKLGDLFTVTTIIVSLVSVLASWHLDRKLERSKEATSIRLAAASTLGDLERWRSLSLSLFDEAQPVIIEASEVIVATEGNTQKQSTKAEQARDLLWRRLNTINNSISQRIRDEKLEGGYISLFGLSPNVRSIYVETGLNIETQRLKMLEQTLANTQEAMLDYMDIAPRTAQVGNALRASIEEIREVHSKELDRLLRPAQIYLIQKIEADDDALLTASRSVAKR